MSENDERHDVVDLLLAQHQRIRSMFEEVLQAKGEARQERFEELRRFLAVHETAEEMVVHPRVRAADDGRAIVEARLDEENSAKKLLADLDGMSWTDPGFGTGLVALKTAVLAHAENEEREEFPVLRRHTDEKTLGQMAAAVRAAEAVAPTHPHPGVESASANLMAGPLASVVDRTRDAVRSVLGRG